MSSTQYVVDTALWLDALDTYFFYFKSIFKLAYEAFIIGISIHNFCWPSSPFSPVPPCPCTLHTLQSHLPLSCYTSSCLPPSPQPCCPSSCVPFPSVTTHTHPHLHSDTDRTHLKERTPVIFEFLSLGNWFELMFYVELICFLANFILFSVAE